MRGVLLAGGNGTRLYPLTRVTNKHLLPVYNKPMIYYPLEFLISCGIKDVVLVTGKEYAGDFAELLGDGSELGIGITYRVQTSALGIAQALGIAEPLCRDESVMVILGDNIFSLDRKTMASLKETVSRFNEGCAIFLKEVENPARFGVPQFDGNGEIIGIEEKPKEPKSRYAVTGLYLYDNTVFRRIISLEMSARGEYEITDVNNSYLKEKKLAYHTLGSNCRWTDAGTFESLYLASSIVREEESPGTRER